MLKRFISRHHDMIDIIDGARFKLKGTQGIKAAQVMMALILTITSTLFHTILLRQNTETYLNLLNPVKTCKLYEGWLVYWNNLIE